ncbi:sodium:proton antiporter [Curtobacterium sp. MCBD17_023]|uniref:cation:proton antiporter n=1 Tax=Curtobacterium sp. MCBD17_023 TaxID=2175657 RepID=UPI000D9BE07D|nr:cation:proton antiporter [Curtobacterium sp. MCBD17_023]PYY51972.1 Na+/H+ antiporter [Curtobacterium sp. MCBD17_023]
MDPVSTITWIVLFVLLTVTVSGLSGKVGWSAPVALVLVGAVLSFVPQVPAIEIEPELVLYGILPPLLFASAIRTSFSDIRSGGDSMLLLSVVLVAVTVATVGVTVWLLVPAVPLAAALAYGAVVAPTDAVAVTAVAGRLRLPRRVLSVLETESLFNDAAALVALNVSIVAIAGVVEPWMIGAEFALAVAGGIGVGLVVGYVIAQVRRRLSAPVLDTSLSLVTPYLAFIPAQEVGGSGVVAVVVAGLVLGAKSPQIQSAQARIAEAINWRTIRFLLENAVFLVIGLSLSGIIAGLETSSVGFWAIVGISLAVLLVLVLSRFAFVLTGTLLYQYGPALIRRRAWGWRTGVALSSAGMRGVVTLAAAFLLPETTPERELLQFLAFIVVAGTLLGGLALPVIVRALRLPPPNADQERIERQLLMAEAQRAGLERLATEETGGVEDRVMQRLRTNASFLTDALENPTPPASEPLPDSYHRLRYLMLYAERDAVAAARSEGRYQDPAVRSVLASIDAEELALRVNAPTKSSDDE